MMYWIIENNMIGQFAHLSLPKRLPADMNTGYHKETKAVVKDGASQSEEVRSPWRVALFWVFSTASLLGKLYCYSWTGWRQQN